MKSHIVIDGNAFYEVDDECMQRRREQEKKKEQPGGHPRQDPRGGRRTPGR